MFDDVRMHNTLLAPTTTYERENEFFAAASRATVSDVMRPPITLYCDEHKICGYCGTACTNDKS